MAQHLLDLGDDGIAAARAQLEHYLPGLDPGLVPLSAQTALLPDTTLLALQRSYGLRAAADILQRAGVRQHRALPDIEALDLLLARDAAAAPDRALRAGVARDWHLTAVKAQDAWARWGGPLAIDWADLRVGQIDTGYLPHPVFGFPAAPWIDVPAGRTFFASGPGTDDGAAVGGSGPGGGVDANQAAYDGHGTRVASVICGHDPGAPPAPFFGVAPRVPLVPVRIANHVFISHAQRELARALHYLLQQPGLGVINLSMGFLPRTQMGVLDRAIDAAYEAGVIVVCAAGQPLASVIAPAHGRRTVAVAGSTVGGIPWGSSAHGTAVDWAAPADAIYRAEVRRDGSAAYAGGGDGTSYAAAITTGAAALWLAHHRNALPARYLQPWQRVEAFIATAGATARAMPHQQPGSFGSGILDIDALLAAPLPDPATLRKQARA
ncbi:MAG: S8/S53 family peptidase [Rubrivivax sp.]|nr:S8/S53 family peptidase [Rubrivivax sp.]